MPRQTEIKWTETADRPLAPSPPPPQERQQPRHKAAPRELQPRVRLRDGQAQAPGEAERPARETEPPERPNCVTGICPMPPGMVNNPCNSTGAGGRHLGLEGPPEGALAPVPRPRGVPGLHQEVLHHPVDDGDGPLPLAPAPPPSRSSPLAPG